MKTFLLAGLIMLAMNINAQPNYLNIGDTLPAFYSAIRNYGKKTITNVDLKNKLTILDFWTVNCGACIAAMPKMKALKDRYGDALQIILVTPNSTTQVEALAKKNKIVKENTLPSIVGDSQVFTRFNFQTVPTHIWLDSTGKVRYIADGWDTNDSTITAYLRGADPKIVQKVENRHFDYKELVRLLSKDNPYAPLLQQYSFFMGRVEGVRDIFSLENDSLTNEPVLITFINEFPLNLITYAFRNAMEFARDNRRIIFEGGVSKNLLEPKEPTQKTLWRNSHAFTYQLKPLAEKRKDALLFMQQDLNRFFGINARVEKREMTCLALVKLPRWKKVDAAERDTTCTFVGDKLIVHNCPVKSLVYLLNQETSGKKSILPFYNDTGSEDNISIELEIGSFKLGDIEPVKKQLKKFGLTLVKKQEWIDMLIISDK